MVKSGLISGGHIQPGPDMAGYENLAGFWPGPGLGPDMISGATLISTDDVLARFLCISRAFCSVCVCVLCSEDCLCHWMSR